MSNINFLELCEQIFNESLNTRHIIAEAIIGITQLCNEGNAIRDRYSKLKQEQVNKARRTALEDKMKIELHKVRERLSQYIIDNNIVDESDRVNYNWLDLYIAKHFSEYTGILHLHTRMIAARPPQEPDASLLAR